MPRHCLADGFGRTVQNGLSLIFQDASRTNLKRCTREMYHKYKMQKYNFSFNKTEEIFMVFTSLQNFKIKDEII